MALVAARDAMLCGGGREWTRSAGGGAAACTRANSSVNRYLPSMNKNLDFPSLLLECEQVLAATVAVGGVSRSGTNPTVGRAGLEPPTAGNSMEPP
jgi:hypothetical protein